jgi:hypothetical protein
LAWGFAGDGEEELEFWGEFVLGVEAVGEVNSANAAVSVDLHSKEGVSYWFKNGSANARRVNLPEGLNVVGSISTSCEV